MPILNQGWEMHIVRERVQRRADGRRRTVGRYQVYHDGVAQDGLSGMTAESKGPGANRPAGNGRRIEEGRYPISTHAPGRYATWGYSKSGGRPRPAFELDNTGKRAEILVHPGQGFLASIGCINVCTSLPRATEQITYSTSRERVIALIDDMKSFLGSDFPKLNELPIPRALVVIDGEP